MSDVDDYVPPQPVYQAAGPWEQQQLGVLADEDGRMAFGEVAPEHFVGPLLIPRNELDLIGVAEVVVAERRARSNVLADNLLDTSISPNTTALVEIRVLGFQL